MSNVLQVNFKIGVPAAEFAKAAEPLASDFAAVPGCRWKIWLVDESRSEAGGIYLFEDKTALQAMLDSPLWAGIRAHPAISDLSTKSWDIIEAPSLVTRGPIEQAVTA